MEISARADSRRANLQEVQSHLEIHLNLKLTRRREEYKVNGKEKRKENGNI